MLVIRNSSLRQTFASALFAVVDCVAKTLIFSNKFKVIRLPILFGVSLLNVFGRVFNISILLVF